MKKLESTWYNMAIVLTLISVVAGAALAYVNDLTAGPIKAIQEKNEQEAIKAVLCSDDAVVTETKEIDGCTLYLTRQGAAVKTTDPANGSFGGGLTIMVGLDEDFHVLGYSILESNETPGLGAKASTWFQKGQKGDIIGKGAGALKVSKDEGEIDAITASTITSRSFLRAVNNAAAIYSKVIGRQLKVDLDTQSGASQQQANNKHK